MSVHAVYSKYLQTRISGPYGPLKILAPAESLLASLTRMFALLTSPSSKSTSLATTSLSWNVWPHTLSVKMFVPPLCGKNVFIYYIFLLMKVRGAIKIENRENLGQCPNRGGRGKKKPEMSQFQFGNFENRGGGSLFFKNVPISIFW